MPRPIFVAAQPKSGSTHLMHSLLRYLERLGLAPQHCGCNVHLEKGIEAQDIHLPYMQAQLEAKELSDRTLVWKQHMMPTPNNLQFLRAFGVKTVVTVRNVPDSLKSLYDHFDRWRATPRREELDLELRFAMPIGLPFHISDWEALDELDRLELLENLYGPWFAWFKFAWKRQQELRAIMVDYDEMWRYPLREFEQIVRYLEVRWDAELAAEALGKEDPMFHQGTPGRGKEHFCRRWPGEDPTAWEALEDLGGEILRRQRAQVERDLQAEPERGRAQLPDLHPEGLQGD